MKCAGVGEVCRGWWTMQGLVDCAGVGGLCRGWWTVQGLVNCAGVGESYYPGNVATVKVVIFHRGKPEPMFFKALFSF